MDEVTKALGPWPILQMVFGLVVLGLGVWSIIRGIRGKEEKMSDEDKREQWEAYNQLSNIEDNTFKLVASQEKLIMAINQLASAIWNSRQFPPHVGLLFAAVILVLSVGFSQARDDGRYANNPLKQWFDGLRSEKGPCCSDADGRVVTDADWRSASGHYEVFLEGQWIMVPDSALITQPNRDGRTIVWPIYSNGLLGIRCFMPGSMT